MRRGTRSRTRTARSTFVYGTVVTAFIALLLATPLSIAIALFLTEIAPKRLAAPIATMVELLAAIPSVVLGLWGILVFGPWVAQHLEPWLKQLVRLPPDLLGRPLAGRHAARGARADDHDHPDHVCHLPGAVPRVPHDLTDGSLALGSTRWEAIRRVSDPYAAPGISAAVLLGLGRAFGEAIAVTQTVGNSDHISTSLFAPGRQAREQDRPRSIRGRRRSYRRGRSSISRAILMVISLATNVTAQVIVRRFEKARRVGMSDLSHLLLPSRHHALLKRPATTAHRGKGVRGASSRPVGVVRGRVLGIVLATLV